MRELYSCTCSECLYVICKVLLEAQEMAVRDHNVEFKSNLWIGVCVNFVRLALLFEFCFPSVWSPEKYFRGHCLI